MGNNLVGETIVIMALNDEIIQVLLLVLIAQA